MAAEARQFSGGQLPSMHAVTAPRSPAPGDPAGSFSFETAASYPLLENTRQYTGFEWYRSLTPEEYKAVFAPQCPAPVDERALSLGLHIVLPIVQASILSKRHSTKIDGHHASGFPSEHPELQGVGRVIRWARVQQGRRQLHSRYHNCYDGVILPKTEQELFMTTLLYVANYVPDVGVDVSGRKARLVKLEPDIRAQLQAPGIISPQLGSEWRVGYFFGQYIMKHGLEPVKETVEAAKFLEARDQLRRYRLGHQVLRLAAEAVLEPVEGIYQTARAQGHISPTKPDRALRFMMLHFNNHQPDYFDSLHQALAA